jgi:hypothetical protein
VSEQDDLKAFIAGVSGFAEMGHADKVRLFAWLQHFLRKKDMFVTKDINWCYEKLLYKPGNSSQNLINMEKAGELLGSATSGYRCEGKFTAKYDDLYKEHDVAINVRQLVKDLEKVIPDIGEKDIFQEALICLRHDAGRAAEIMVWNIAMYHLYQFILTHHLKGFNDRIPIRFQNKNKWSAANMPLIKKYDDFGDEMSEREVIDVASSAGIINDDVYKTYKNRLDQRNSAAHPSTLRVTQVQAEGFIDDLIRNAVLQLKI